MENLMIKNIFLYILKVGCINYRKKWMIAKLFVKYFFLRNKLLYAHINKYED